MQAEHPGREAERLLAAAIATPGLYPRWSQGAPPDTLPEELRRRVADSAGLAAVPARDWPPALLELWRAGHIFLIDERSRLGGTLALSARRLVLRESSLGPFSSVIGDGVLLERSIVRNHTSLEGLLALVETLVHPYVALGPVVVAVKSAFQSFSKAQRGVRIDRSLVGSHTAIEGGNHPERIPLGPQRRVIGVQIGPSAWIGQHVSVTAGAIIGAGVVVAPHTAVSKPVSEHVMVAGSPAREHPIDFNIRGLSPEEARAEGRAQGSIAVDLPIFGPHRGALRDPLALEIDFPEHGVLRGLASESLLHFQAGVLESAFVQMFPDHRAEVSFQTGKTVRFTVGFDKPLVRPAAFRTGPPSGMLGISLDPTALAKLFDHLAGWDTPPLPPFESIAAPPVAVPTTPADVGTIALLATMLQELLGTKAEIDVDAPFYALGVDSLTAADLATRLEKELGIKAPDVFAHNSVRRLADAVERLRHA